MNPAFYSIIACDDDVAAVLCITHENIRNSFLHLKLSFNKKIMRAIADIAIYPVTPTCSINQLKAIIIIDYYEIDAL
jgi:hypothetical protein